MAKSKIDYADWSWGIVDGCTHSGHPGCDNCWAKAMADRFWKDRKFSDVQIHPERLDEVIKLKPQVVFVAPMGDLFHKDVPDDIIEKAFITMGLKARQHKYILFTKRPERMREFMNGSHEFVQDHIWLGVSVSTQKDVNEFLPILCDTSAGKRIVSAEPLLEYIDMSYFLNGCPEYDGYGEYGYPGWVQTCAPINGIFTGCESGTNRRKANIDWFRSLRNQCEKTKVKYYLKQMEVDGNIVHKPLLDGRQWLEFPERNA